MWGSVPFCTNGVNLINEYDTGGVFLRHTEDISYEFRTIPKVFLDEFGADDTKESR